MKEAAGEANMTVITIVLIAVVLAVGTIIVNSLMDNTELSSCCSSNGGVWWSGACYQPNTCTQTTNGTDCSSGTSFTPSCS